MENLVRCSCGRRLSCIHDRTKMRFIHLERLAQFLSFLAFLLVSMNFK